MNPTYQAQAELLVQTIPSIAKETCFALKGGTAINLFYRNMPRLSVDIDLTYLGFEPRDIARELICSALKRIAAALERGRMQVAIQGGGLEKKLIISNNSASIKVEPNYTLRGHIYDVEVRSICPGAEQVYGFAEIALVSVPELYGGKICAALDRQHPRDLFDISTYFSEANVDSRLMHGFIAMLLSHNRPPYELVDPIIKNQQEVFTKEFIGMTDKNYSYADHMAAFEQLCLFIRAGSAPFKELLTAFFSLEQASVPSLIPNLERLPAIQWTLHNLRRLKENNKKKFEHQLERLKAYLETV